MSTIGDGHISVCDSGGSYQVLKYGSLQIWSSICAASKFWLHRIISVEIVVVFWEFITSKSVAKGKGISCFVVAACDTSQRVRKELKT
uniref:Uncharacterized protein n=1 Tax=Candidozyma auris TaxID=498019 RepID=A0A0L0P4I9_CANAR